MYVKNRAVMLALSVLGGLVTDGAFAADLGKIDYSSMKDAPVTTKAFSLDLGIGVKSGEANEYIYYPDGSKLSQLIWKYDENIILNGGFQWTPVHWLTLGVKGSISLDDASNMDDWDWLAKYPDAEFMGCPNDICHSSHPDTQLDRNSMVDLYAAGIFYRKGNFSLAGLAGWKWDYSKWKAYNGTANYIDEPFEGLGVTYEQSWSAPYLGIQVNAEFDRWTIGGKVIGSWWVNSDSTDTHHFRDLTVKSDFGSSDMIGASAEIGYKLGENAALTLNYDYQKWDVAKGAVTANETYMETNAEGMDSETHSVSLGVNYKF